MATASAALRALMGRPAVELVALMRSGRTPDLEGLVGAELLGACTAPWMRLVGMGKLIKGFERHADGRIVGYNRRVAQNGLDAAWVGPSRPFAAFEVRAMDPGARDARYPHALLFDYAAGPGSLLAPWRPIRDYVVRVDDGPAALLLGHAVLAIGTRRPTLTFFALEA